MSPENAGSPLVLFYPVNPIRLAGFEVIQSNMPLFAKNASVISPLRINRLRKAGRICRAPAAMSKSEDCDTIFNAAGGGAVRVVNRDHR
jgi:hypothetical protein